ncbi:hypothetical protein [Xylophilus sp. ASV27]|uniref:hypothetical protein n=1 Tax=Xylophilus sp. ASV27 TaxID=2795129 RepID=UPI0018EBE320|nr:hypothetical protein [Xylophilus sp. ASV27]
MLLQLEQQYLQANLAQARAMLADVQQDDDPIGQHQMAQLVRQLETKLLAMPGEIAQAPAGVALFFGGRPVVGSLGIHADFGSKAIERFQTIVSQRFAAEEVGPLASKGRVPMKDATHLLVTDVVRGSFGFVLQGAPQDQTQVLDTTLKEIVDKVADTISRVAAQDEALFDGAVAEIDERQKGALTEFFKLLDTEGATMRIVEGGRDFELDQASVQRARHRVENMRITDRTQELEGQIVGWTDYSAKFELRLHESRELIQGSIAPQTLNRLAAEGVEPYHKHVRVHVKVREVVARNRQPKISYTLLSLVTHPAPVDWSTQGVQNIIR